MTKKICLTGLLMIFLFSSPPLRQAGLRAQERPPDKRTEKRSAEKGISINLADTSLGFLLHYISKREGKPLIYEKGFPSKELVNIISPRGVTIPTDKLLGVMKSILRMKGYTLISTGDVIKVVKSVGARTQPLVVKGPEDLDKIGWEDEIVTQIIPLKYASASKLLGILNQLKTKGASILPSKETNTLIITEFASNIKQLYEIIKQIDQPPAPDPYQTATRQLKYASAASVYASLTQYVAAMTRATPKWKQPFVSFDERTNSLIIFALEPDLKQLLQLVETLDIQTPEKQTTAHIYKLSNTTAEDVAKILQSTFVTPLAALPKGAKKPQISITAEKSTNSLVVMTLPKIHEEIEALIKKIDVKRTQVLIEAAVVEITMERLLELGIELAATKPESTAKRFRGYGDTAFGLATGDTALAEGLTLGVWKKIGDKPVIPFILKMAQRGSGVNVLAVPRILTNDNAEASIIIADQIPSDKTIYGPDGLPTGVTFDQYLQAGIELTITPHISENNYLRLEIHQKVEQFFASAYSTSHPAKTTRETKTEVTVPDKETIIIGGLIGDSKTKVVTKVPILGDIPLLKIFFRRTKEEVKKTNLCIFITPHIMREFSELIEKTGEEKEALERLRKLQPKPGDKK